MRLFIRLAWRNLWRHRRRTLIVVVSIGMTLGLMMFYDGMIAGFDQAIYGNAIKVLGGNVQIHANGYRVKKDQSPLFPLENEQAIIKSAEELPQVVVASRRIITGGLVSNREGAFSVSIVGVEPDKELIYNLIAQHVSEGRYLTTEDPDNTYVGKGLAIEMGVSVGDRITLVGRATHKQMRTRTMTIIGIYDIGMPEIEKRSVYVSLSEAQNLYDLNGQVTEVTLSLKQLGQEQSVIGSLRSLFPGYEIDSWETNFPELQYAIETKTGVMNIFGIIMYFIAGIGILNLLLMAIFERTREIGLMGALGMKPRQISLLFLLEGALMGLVGVAFGVIVGLCINILVGQVGIDYSQFASITEYTALINGRIYTTLGLDKLLQHALVALIIAVLASLYPASEAAKSEPAKALHFV